MYSVYMCINVYLLFLGGWGEGGYLGGRDVQTRDKESISTFLFAPLTH